MNKELEALKFIFGEALFSEYKNETHTKVRECHSIVYEALKRLEAIDNANPSKALELIGYLKDYLLNMMPYYDWLNDIEKYILKAQEQEKKNAEYKQLEQQLGCPLDMVLNLVKETNKLDEHCRTQDIWFDYKGKLISGSFATLKYHNNEFIIEVETYEMFDSNYDCDSYELLVKDYKKTWWLKEDKSE